MGPQAKAALTRERRQLLEHIDTLIDRPMVFLSIGWVVLTIIQLVRGLNSTLLTLTFIIWGVFIGDFLLELVIAPDRLRYLRNNWLVALSLLVPAAGILRLFRAAQLLRAGVFLQSASLARIIAAVNRGLRALQSTLQGRGITYVAAMTVLVLLLGSAGILHFENPKALHQDGIGIPANMTTLRSYGDALWWTAMMMTTVGSDYWPHTVGGRVLTVLLAVYAFMTFGYLTANIASLFIDKTRQQPNR